MKRIIFIFLAAIHAIHSMEQPPRSISEQIVHQQGLPQGVQSYLQNLPKISDEEIMLAKTADPHQKAVIITHFLLRFGGYNSDVAGKDSLIAKMSDVIAQDKPILRCMPGFPISSQNKDKIPLNDDQPFSMGDFVALLTQAHVSKEITRVHAPGSSLAIFWEPFIHKMNKVCQQRLGSPLFSAERIAHYQGILQKMTTALAPHFRQPELCPQQINALFESTYEKIDIKIDQEKVKHYQTFMKGELETPEWMARAEEMLFIKERAELEKKYPALVGKTFKEIQNMSFYKRIKATLGARNHLHRIADELGEIAFVGGNQMARLMENEIPHYAQQIRQTVRADVSSVEKKLGIPMIFGSKGTPWHKMLVVKNNGVELAADKSSKAEKECGTFGVCKIGDHELKYIDHQTPQ